MNRKEVVAIAVRLFSIALAIYGLNNLPGMVMYFDREEFQNAAYVFTGVSSLTFIVAILLWFFPYTVASKILPNENPEKQAYSWNREEALTCGFIILGVYFLYYVISDAIYWLYISNYSLSFEDLPVELNADQLARIYATIVEFVITILLIFGSRGIANIILKLRYTGINSSNN
ncbi:hypothetical protein MNBD_GAMMA26-2558 [hydrothermal vent metagenome]|uniref:Uncharacterized protein n=1 Tax=hydrothermal vent metagenome TaxID=652676 RepID=A0A3B1ATM2_9ZZZZ